MVPLFTVSARPPKVTGQSPALRERTETRTRTTALKTARVSWLSPALDQDSIDIARPIHSYLNGSDRTTYELHVQAREGKDRKLARRVGEPPHLLLPHKEYRVPTGRSAG